jgi:hypothetical protein
MSRHCHSQFWLAALLLTAVCVPSGLYAQSAKPADSSQPEKMTNQTRILVIRSLQSERVFARVMFPQGEKGLKIKNGSVIPSDSAVAQQVAEFGAAAKPGDRCVITDVKITDKSIAVEINGGPKKKGKWYQHIELGAGGATAPVPGGPSPQSLDAHGSVVTLEFDKFVPDVSGDQVRAMLAPVFDFKALNASEAYEKTLPPKLKEAIKDHKILVGMDKEMVMFAKGRPQQRIRDKDEKGEDYEEWIYGTPPEEVNFVRFKGNEVSRLEIMDVDGKKIVRTEREVDLPSKEAELAQQKPAAKPQQPAPSLRRPGEEVEITPVNSGRRAQCPQGSIPSGDGSTCTDNTGANPTTIPPINPNDGSTPHLAPAS